MENFNDVECRMRLLDLDHTHQRITKMSLWCLSREKFHRDIVKIWEEIAAEAAPDYLILMFYVANDIVQHSKRNDLAFHYSFLPAFQKVMPLFSDPVSRGKVSRILAIWSERSIYNETILSDLEKSLSGTSDRREQNESREPSNPGFDQSFFSKLRSSFPLGKESSPTNLETRSEPVNDDNADEIRLKMGSLQKEIKERKGLIEVLEKGMDAYQTALDEASEVHEACKQLLTRIQSVQKVLREKHGILPLLCDFPSEQTDFRSENPFVKETCPYEKKLSTQLEEYLCEGNFREENYVNSDAPRFSERRDPPASGYGNSYFPASSSSYYRASSSSPPFFKQGDSSNMFERPLKPPEFFEAFPDQSAVRPQRVDDVQYCPRNSFSHYDWRGGDTRDEHRLRAADVWSQVPRNYHPPTDDYLVRRDDEGPSPGSRVLKGWTNLTDDSKLNSLK